MGRRRGGCMKLETDIIQILEEFKYDIRQLINEILFLRKKNALLQTNDGRRWEEKIFIDTSILETDLELKERTRFDGGLPEYWNGGKKIFFFTEKILDENNIDVRIRGCYAYDGDKLIFKNGKEYEIKKKDNTFYCIPDLTVAGEHFLIKIISSEGKVYDILDIYKD